MHRVVFFATLWPHPMMSSYTETDHEHLYRWMGPRQNQNTCRWWMPFGTGARLFDDIPHYEPCVGATTMPADN